ncbi:MAG: F0F1 ATP synthase subunit A [Actinomycetota bacterium]|nr:F0F1 ATP synthase subunit A [Actinomycetota bacterium]
MTILAAEDIVGHLLDYELPWGVTAHQVLLAAVAVFTIGLFWWAAKRIKTHPEKKGVVALLEVGLVFVRDDIVYPWLGHERGRRYLAFFWTMFFFILFANLIGLAPFPFNPWERTATGNLAVTGALAAIVFVMVQVSGMKQHGWGKYWLHLVPGGSPKFLWPLLFVIELLGLFTRHFALTVRLFANMTGGHAILLVLFGFLLGIKHYASPLLGAPSTVASFGFILFIMLFETLIALIQAYIFTVLAAIFTSLAVAEEH